MMKRYANRNGSSGVSGYELGDSYIRVRFVQGGIYEYTYASAGAAHIEAMKKRALAGRGLSTYISQHVKDRYAKKVD